VVDVEEHQRTHAAFRQRVLDRALQAVPVRQVRQRVVERQVLDAPGGEMLLRDVPRLCRGFREARRCRRGRRAR
jgi:hypothetical protein